MKERIRQLEKELAICRKTIKKMSKKISVLKQEIFRIDPGNPIFKTNDQL
jgi:predicted  nucleic acid-binding Zn-ribbon protein